MVSADSSCYFMVLTPPQTRTFGCLTVLRISTSRRSISGRVTRDFVTVLTAKVADLCGNYTFTVPRSLVVLTLDQPVLTGCLFNFVRERERERDV